MAKISCFVGLINFNQISIIYYNNETRHTSFGHTHHITTEIPIYSINFQFVDLFIKLSIG